MKLKKGSKAPTFAVSDQDENIVSLKDFAGKKLVIFFYPKDNTPTCTEEACNLRDNISLLKKKGIAVVGVSTDSVRRHKNFERKFSLPFPLLADEDKTMVEAYGVWGKKKLFGVDYLGILRTTFLINEDGKIAHIIEKVKAREHTEQILEAWGL